MSEPDFVQKAAARAGVSLEEDRAATVAEVFAAFVEPDLALMAAEDLGSEPPAAIFNLSTTAGIAPGYPHTRGRGGA